MVYDVFPFFNELDILKMRLHILDHIVDRFVIEEATHTFSGMEKELCFEKNQAMFAAFLPKIDYVIVSDSPPELNPHQRDRYQKNHLINGLKGVHEEDIIIFSDVDEIPNPLVLEKIIADFDPEKVYHLAQRMFHGYLNREEISRKIFSITGEFPHILAHDKNIGLDSGLPHTPQLKWLGSKVFSARHIPEAGIVHIREFDPASPASIRVDDGGWHFSYMGGSNEADVSKRVIEKIKAAAHQEYNHQDTLAEVGAKTVLGKDFLGSEAQFARVEIDESFPQYLREHRDEYAHLIMEPVAKHQAIFIKLSMLIRRFFRKLIRRIKRFFKTGKIRRDREIT